MKYLIVFQDGSAVSSVDFSDTDKQAVNDGLVSVYIFEDGEFKEWVDEELGFMIL